MAIYNIIKLKNFTPTHIGSGNEYYDFSADDLQSDTISAALAAIRAQENRSADIQDFLHSFVISNAFPFYKNSCFLPKTQGKINATIQGKSETEYRKKLKKIKYIDTTLWGKLAQGEKISLTDEQIKGNFIVASADFETPYTEQVNQRVSVSRADGQDAEPFFFNWRYYHAEAGLYCLLKTDNNAIFDEIKQLFEKLGEVGFGTDKNVGGGKFDVETSTIELPEVAEATHRVLLSNYVPLKTEMAELNISQASYAISLRGGYIAGSSGLNFRHLRKRSVYMFNAGSVFLSTRPLVGDVCNLRPDWNDAQLHPVFRSGKAFCLPIKTAKL